MQRTRHEEPRATGTTPAERDEGTPSTRSAPLSTRAAPASTRAAPLSTRPPPSTRFDAPLSRPAPQSGHDAGPLSARSGRATGPAPASSRTEELAHLYRKIADMQAELAEAEARFDRAMRSSAGADEMVGQMLARVAEVEARLAAAQKQASDAEARAGELAAQLGKARAAQAEIADRLRAAESRLLGEHQELDRAQAELEAARTEATVGIAAAEEAQDALLRERDTVSVLRADLARAEAQLAREREERESLRARVREFAEVCDERDKALLREELLEADLEATRQELAEAKRRATSGEHRLGAEVDQKDEQIARLEGDLAQIRARTGSVDEQLADALLEIDELAKAKQEVERLLAEAEAAARAARAELAAERSRVAELSIERELHDGISAQTEAEHEAALDALRRAHEAEVEELRQDLSAAEARAGDLSGQLRDAVEDVSRMLADIEQQEADAARVRGEALAAARERLDRVMGAERGFDGEAAYPRSEATPRAEREDDESGDGEDDDTEVFSKALLRR